MREAPRRHANSHGIPRTARSIQLVISSSPRPKAMSSSVSAASQFLDDLKDALVKAFMNAPQLDSRTNARVPLDLAVPSQAARARLMENQSGNYWATVPQLPIVPSSA